MDAKQPKGSYFLVALHGDKRRVSLFPQGPLLVGRGTHNHLVLNDYRISRQHSRVAPERDGFVVYDLNSANGTFVNSVSVRRQILKPDDVVSFGPLAFRLELVLDEAASVRGSAHNPTARGWRATESVTQFNRVIPPAIRAAHPNNIRDTIPPESSDEDARPTHLPPPMPAESVPTQVAVPPRPPPLPNVPPSNPKIIAEESSQSLSGPRDSTRFKVIAGAIVDLNQLEDAYEKLGTLYAFMHAISKTLDKTKLLALIADKILDIYPQARSVGIYLRNPDRKDLETPFQLNHFAGGEMTTTLPTVTARAILRDQNAVFSSVASGAMTGGLTMYTPIIDTSDVLGVICVEGEPRHGGFTLADLELLKGIAAPAAIMLQNTRFYEESVLRERLSRDLELAAQIQKSFLPREGINAPGFEFLATYKAAFAVSGDFYDVFPVGDDQVAVFIGDISGKGVAAALMMARISGELRVAALAHVDPISVFTIMNKALVGRDQPELFFTAIYFTLNVKTGAVTIASAGHPPPYVCHADGSIDIITEGASGAIGMLEDPVFSATELHLRPGDSLVLYTDGVSEAADVRGNLYGDERLAKALAASGGSRPKDISERVLRSIEQHTRNAQANDDITIFICYRQPEKPVSAQTPRQFSSRP